MGRIKEDGFVLIKKAFDVSEVVKDISGIFEAYSSFEEDFDVMAKSLFVKDNEGFVGCANSAQYLPSLMSLASSCRPL